MISEVRGAEVVAVFTAVPRRGGDMTTDYSRIHRDRSLIQKSESRRFAVYIGSCGAKPNTVSDRTRKSGTYSVLYW